MGRLLSLRCRPVRLALGFGRRRDGSAAVEFALVMPIFAALLFAILETGLVFYAGQVLENATQDAARLVLTGQMRSSQVTADSFKTEVCKHIVALLDCSGITIDVRSFGIHSPAKPDDPIVGGRLNTSGFGFNTGIRGDIVMVRLFYEWPLVVTGLGFDIADLDGNKRLLQSTMAFRNEPF